MNTFTNMAAKVKIKSKTVLETLSKKLLRNEGGHVAAITIGKKFAKLETMMIPGSGLTALLKVTTNFMVKAGGNTSKVVARFFTDALYVQFVGNGDNAGSHRTNIVFQGVYIKHDGRHTKVLVNQSDDYYFDMLKHCNVAKKNVDITEYIKMIVIGATPSMLRKKQILMGNAELPWVEIINKLSVGALAMQEGIEGNMAKLNKLFARMFHMWAPHKHVGTADTFAFYNGIFTNKLGNAAWDGMMFLTNTFAAKCLSRTLNVDEVTEKSVLGMAMQMRPDTNKAFGSVVSENFMGLLMADGKPVYRFNRDELDKATQKEIWNGEKYKNAWIIIGDDKPEYLSDRNCLKAEFDLRKGGKVFVLAVAKYSSANTSIQMLSKVAANTSKEVFTNLVASLFRRDIDSKLVNIQTKTGSMISVRDAASGYIQGIVDKIAPQYIIEKDQQLYLNVIETLAKSGMKAANNLKFRVDGGSLSLMSDISELIGGENILKYGEIYAPYANAYFKGKTMARLATLIKYPSVGTGEFYQATCVSLDEIRRRVGQLDCSIEVKREIISWYSSLSRGVLVVPTTELLKKLLAGLDFDFDGATMILDEEINKVMSTIRPRIVDIDPGSVTASDDKYALGFENFHHVLRAFINSPNKSVGEITVMNDTIIALINAPFAEAKKRLISMLGIAHEGVENFRPLQTDVVELDGVLVDRVFISPTSADDFIANLRNTKFTEQNMRQILLDIVAIFRYYQEVTIDSVKTGVTVNVDFKMDFVTKTVLDINHRIEEGNMNIHLAEKEERTSSYIDDVINSARISCAKGVAHRINTLLLNKPEFDTDDMAMFEAAKQGQEETEAALVEMKLLYNDLTGSHLASVRDFTARKMETDGLKADQQKRIDELANMMRRITADLDPVDRALLTKAVSMTGKTGTRADGGSKFATILAPEYIRMISDKWGESGLAGAEIIGRVQDGDVLEFVDGQSDEAITVDEAINGTFTVKTIGKKLYATKPVTELLTIPAVDNSRLMFKLHWSVKDESLENAATMLQSLSKVKLTANPKEKDTVRDLEGNVIARISCEGKVLSSLFNGVVGEVAEVDIAEFSSATGKTIKSCIVTLKNITAAVAVPDETEVAGVEASDNEVFGM